MLGALGGGPYCCGPAIEQTAFSYHSLQQALFLDAWHEHSEGLGMQTAHRAGATAVLQAQMQLSCAGSHSAITGKKGILAMLELSCRCAHVMEQRIVTLRILWSLRRGTIAALVRST